MAKLGELPTRVDALVAQAVAGGDVPGAVVAVASADATHVATAGVMALGGPPMRRDTVFRIASITKPIIAALVLSLIDDGTIRLDDPVERWLPELADRRVLRRPDSELADTVPARRPIVVRDLLTFTWGFGMQGAMFLADTRWPIFTAAQPLHTFGPAQPDHTPDPDTWMACLGELPLLAQPGERWLYQSGAQVLGVLASRLTGRPLADALSERILEPLGMVDTGFHATDPSRLATAYHRHDGRLEVSDPPDGQWSRSPAFPDGGSGLLSTVDDLVAFGRMLLRGGSPVLNSATAAEMTRNQLTEEQRTNVWPGFSFLDDRGWGYGLSVRADGRYGWEGGAGTSWTNVPAKGLVVVVLTQRAADETGLPTLCEEVLEEAVTGLS